MQAIQQENKHRVPLTLLFSTFLESAGSHLSADWLVGSLSFDSLVLSGWIRFTSSLNKEYQEEACDENAFSVRRMS